MGAQGNTGAVWDRELTTEAVVIAATLVCIGRFGLTKTTLDDVARESGISRATIYRAFPGGRDTLFDAVLAVEVERFFTRLDDVVAPCETLEDLLVAGLDAAMGFLAGNAALRTILELEPGLVLPRFAFHRLDQILAQVNAAVGPYLTVYVGDRAPAVAEHLVRIVLTYAINPAGSVDPTDTASIRRLVRHHVLPGLIAPTPQSPNRKPAP